jgi:hypothetical protein
MLGEILIFAVQQRIIPFYFKVDTNGQRGDGGRREGGMFSVLLM